jgi:hypothetical protein
VITPVVLPGAEHMAAPTSRPMLHQRKKAWLAPITAYGADDRLCRTERIHFEGKSISTREARLGSIKFLPGRYSLNDLPLLLTGVVLYSMEVGGLRPSMMGPYQK